MDEAGQEMLTKNETEQRQLKVVDSRKEPNASQQLGLTERLKIDEVKNALVEAKRFLGDYSPTEPESLEVEIVEGRIGEGTINGTIIEVQIPQTEEAIQELEQLIGQLLKGIPLEDRRQKHQEILMVLTSSTVLHEGIHGLIDSKPGSKFAVDFERISGLENTKGRISTLLDEGITYAIQGIYAKEVEPLGSLIPTVKDSDAPEVKQRKILGEYLKPKVEEYIKSGKAIDDEFLSFAAEKLRGVL